MSSYKIIPRTNSESCASPETQYINTHKHINARPLAWCESFKINWACRKSLSSLGILVRRRLCGIKQNGCGKRLIMLKWRCARVFFYYEFESRDLSGRHIRPLLGHKQTPIYEISYINETVRPITNSQNSFTVLLPNGLGYNSRLCDFHLLILFLHSPVDIFCVKYPTVLLFYFHLRK